MRADRIIKGAKIFTSDKERPYASALAVKDGTFCYVGDEAGLAEVEGEVTDLTGKFIMPGIVDSHVHVTFPVGFEYSDMGLRFECEGKQGALDFMAAYIREHPGQRRYKFLLEKKCLAGDDIEKRTSTPSAPTPSCRSRRGRATASG